MTVQVDELDTRRMSALMRESDVVAVAPSIPMKLIAPVSVPGTPAPAAPGPTWGVKAVGADTSPFTGSGVVVSVLDTGIDASHPAFAGVDITQKDFTGEGDGDQHGHGTHCAGTIFGRAGADTRIGVAEGVTKALIGKVLGAEGGSSDQIVNAIQWAVANGANVISMSLGMDFPGLVEELIRRGFPPALATSRALEAYRANVQLFERLAALVRVQEAFTQTTVIVAAAGNESERNQNPDFELGVSPPAVSEGIISVAAIRAGHAGVLDRVVLEHRGHRRRSRRQRPVGQTGRRSCFDERHEHGHAARRWRGGAVGREDQEHRPAHGHAAHLAPRGVGCHRRLSSRIRSVRHRQRSGARAAAVVAADSRRRTPSREALGETST